MAIPYEQVLQKPFEEIKHMLEHAQYRELQGFCQHMEIAATGKHAEVLQRAIEHVEKFKGVTSPTPTGFQTGFQQHAARQIDRAKSAGLTGLPKVRGTSSSASSAGEASVLHKFRKHKSDATGASRSRVLLEKVLAAKDVEKPQESSVMPSGKWSPELERKRQEMEVLLAQTREKPADLPGVPALPGSGPEVAGMQTVIDTLGVVVTGINELRAGMADTVKYTDLKQFHVQHSQEIQTYVSSKVDPVIEDQIELKSNVVDLMKDSVAHDDRIGRLESRLEELLELKNKGPDEGFKRIVFKSFPEKISLDDRLDCMKEWMRRNFSKIDFSMNVIYTGSFKDKNRKMTGVGYVQFPSSDIRNAVFDRFESQKIDPPKIGGKSLKVERGRSRIAGDRNKALREAADALKELPDVNKESVDIKWIGKRGVTINEVFAFEQPPGKDLGKFVGEYSRLDADS